MFKQDYLFYHIMRELWICVRTSTTKYVVDIEMLSRKYNVDSEREKQNNFYDFSTCLELLLLNRLILAVTSTIRF